VIRDGVVRLRLDDRELWCDWKCEYGEQESEHEAPTVLITFEVQGWKGLGSPSSGEADGRVDFHFRGHEPERKVVAATLKRIAEELDPDPASPV
jgi:hypothetical protein